MMSGESNSGSFTWKRDESWRKARGGGGFPRGATWLFSRRFGASWVYVLRVAGCATFSPHPKSRQEFLARAVTEERDGLLQKLATIHGIARFGFVGGVGAAPPSAPRTNLTNDPYFTDGLRLVLFLADQPTAVENAEFLNWELPQGVP